MAMLNSHMVISFPFASRPQAMTLQIEKIGFATPRRVSGVLGVAITDS